VFLLELSDEAGGRRREARLYIYIKNKHVLANGRFLLCCHALMMKCDVSAKGLLHVRQAPLKQTSGLQKHFSGNRDALADNTLGIDSGWKQSRQNQIPLRGDETRSLSSPVVLDTALVTPLRFFRQHASPHFQLQVASLTQGVGCGPRRPPRCPQPPWRPQPCAAASPAACRGVPACRGVLGRLWGCRGTRLGSRGRRLGTPRHAAAGRSPQRCKHQACQLVSVSHS